MSGKTLALFCAAIAIGLVASIPATAATLFSDDFESGVSGSSWEVVPGANNQILVGDSAHAFGTQSAKQVTGDPSIYYMRTKLGAFTNPGTITAGNKEVASVQFWDDNNRGDTNGSGTTNFGGALMLAKDGLSDFYQLGVNNAVSANNYYMRTSLGGNVATSVARTQGWHELRIEVLPYTGSGDVQFYIDNVNVGSGPRKPSTGSGFDLNEIRLGLSVKTPDSNFWFDNVSLDMVPEPASLSLLGLGLAGLTCFRRRPANRRIG